MNRKPGGKKNVEERQQEDLRHLKVSDLRRGILLQELLGPPRALKRFQWTLFRRR
ncbi:MAG: hypothetical protein WB502_10410 [Thermoactinomyces sp.]